MKNKISLLLAALVFTLASFTNLHNETLVIKTSIACSHCNECGSCFGNIRDHLVKDAKAKSVVIDSKANTITVVYSPHQTTPEALRQAVLAAGFEADGVAPAAADYNKLDGCCKKH